MIVFVGALLILAGFAAALWRGALPRKYIPFFLVGAALGLVWEIAFTAIDMGYPILPGGAPNPVGDDMSDLPGAVIATLLVIVCIWDGALFVAGLVLARLALGPRVEERFSLAALLMMQIWGQAQSLFIEIFAIENGFWAYEATANNPRLFDWGEAQLTLWPQLVWFLAYFAFYAAVLAVSRRGASPVPR